ncbi:MAG TPA: hypothetical protein VHE30_02970 [Polyangiaceae bacterium]|nr:hypothetical protein [Polyangiaceae bacterium]
MHSNPKDSSPLDAPSASARLVAAALSGLLGLAIPACGSDTKPTADSTSGTGGTGSGGDPGAGAPGTGGDGSGGSTPDSDAGAPETYNNVITEDAGSMTMDAFQKLCEGRGGYVYRNAACAGGSMCKGLSWHGGTLWDHSCRGQNSACAGVGCLDLPKDTGLTGQEIYESGPCGNCHADWSGDEPNYKKYALVYDPYTLTGEEVTKRFQESSDERLLSSVVWGVQGFYTDYIPFSNMPAYYQKYSLAEIRRVVEHVKTLETFPYAAEQFGKTPGYGISPEAGVPVPEPGAPPVDAGAD